MSRDVENFDWNHIRAFLAVVDHGSLSGAARALGQTQPTLSRQINALETALRSSLIIRGSREAALTDAGVALLEEVRKMADAAGQISRIAKGRNQTIEGTIRITATDAMVSHVLPECLKALRAKHPGVNVELIASNANSDLTRHDADIAVRHVRPDQPDLIAKRVGDFDVSLFASSEYLASLGDPITSQVVSGADFIGFEHPERLVPQIKNLGISVSKDNFKIVASSGMVLYELARQGLGIALLPTVVATQHFGLRPVQPDLPEMRLPIWLVTHRDVQTNLRIRLCFDLIASALEDFQKQ